MACGKLCGMDPHLLRTYVFVARLASFSEAARKLGYTQSAVSQHIAALEQDLGAPLLTRRPVAPTAAGERLLEHAGPLLLRLEAARADVVRMAAAPDHGLTLATASTALGPRVLAALPAAGVTLRVLPRAEVPAAVATGTADLGLVDGLAAPSDPLRLPDVAPLTTYGVGRSPSASSCPTPTRSPGAPACASVTWPTRAGWTPPTRAFHSPTSAPRTAATASAPPCATRAPTSTPSPPWPRRATD